MPRRTNAFQTLITLVQNAIQGMDASVTESAMVWGHHGEAETEIDILVEFKKGGVTYRTGVECRDHKRKGDRKWIHELVGKRHGCRLDRILAVHSRGFTSSAITLAEEKHVSLYVLERLSEEVTTTSPALRFAGGPLVSYSLLSATCCFVEPDEDAKLPTHPPSHLYRADHRTTESVDELLRILLAKDPPSGDHLESGQSTIADGRLPLPQGQYFLKYEGRFLPVAGFLVTVQVVKSAPLCGSSVNRLADTKGNAVADVAAAVMPGPGGLWIWSTTVDAESRKPQAVIQPPRGVHPLNIRSELEVTYTDADTGEQKTARVPGRTTLLDDKGEPIPIFAYKLEIAGFNHAGPPELQHQDILGFSLSDKKTPTTPLQFAASYVQENGLPDEDLKAGERKKERLKMSALPKGKPALLLKALWEGKESFFTVNSVTADLEWWLHDEETPPPVTEL